jgi:ribosomal protein S18 acetylase RimI-like enzyme
VKDILDNPVFNALISGDKALSIGSEEVKYFDPQVSPFVGFNHQYEQGFEELYQLLPAGRKILYAKPTTISQPSGWQLLHEVKGLQFVYKGSASSHGDFAEVQHLNETHVPQMLELAKLTRPGPFESKTIRFGSYYGIFEKDQLVAMTGQRLHVGDYTEVSAVCTYPGFTGKGYAHTLMQHQLMIIMQNGQQPFLHVKDDNLRAISLYRRLGFTVSRDMNFYFMIRQ